ncbi:hypothetical protein [Cryobacterium sp. M96]|uniref:hypothetical protein n=1 Tax=Cryobacterium sp. M96 TaxID=2048295 RepID=UPI0011B08B99|nr:hypothetical protein [Cryobacterium sp. M96]
MLIVSGCAAGSESQSVTPKQVEETTTTSTVDAAIAAIDPTLIDHVDQVMNAVVGCLGTDGKPLATLRAWQNMRYVWLIDGTEPLAVANALVKNKEKAGWTTSGTGNEITGEETGAARTMTRVPAGDSNDTPGLSISTGSNTAVPPVIYLSSTSICLEGGALLP